MTRISSALALDFITSFVCSYLSGSMDIFPHTGVFFPVVTTGDYLFPFLHSGHFL